MLTNNKRRNSVAQLLNDHELEKLFKTIIINADKDSLRPNAYILRMGCTGEFTTISKEFTLEKGQGLKLPPGHSIAVTALETIDFREETVNKIYPGCSLHGLLSPTTDLSREGLTVASTQVDAGYYGTLNWTINNHSSRETKFLYGEKLFRMTILKLEQGEVPSKHYMGDYQGQEGYVPSARKGPPVGMKESSWIDPLSLGSPEEKLEALIKSGYPWNLLGTELKQIDDRFETITKEYSRIDDSIKELNTKLHSFEITLKSQENKNKENIQQVVSEVLRDQIIKCICGLGSLFGAGLIILTSEQAMSILTEQGGIFGVMLILASIFLFFVGKK